MKRVFILGAGASKFAGFPLATGLWPFLEAQEDTREIQLINDVALCRPFIKKAFCLLENLSYPDLEIILTIADLAVATGGSIGGFNSQEFDIPQVKSVLRRLVSSAFKDRAVDARQNDENRIIMETWAERVQEGDIIISFNWDPLHEMALFQTKKWHYSSGYGFKPKNVTQKTDSQVTILKLHGSANWGLRAKNDPGPPTLDYINEIFRENDAPYEPSGESDFGQTLILPSYLKAPSEEPVLVSLWNKAADALREAEEIIILGYSLPEGDGPARTLLSTALTSNNKLKAHEKPIRIVAGQTKGFGSAYDHWDNFFNRLDLRDYVQMIHQRFEEFVKIPL